MWSAFLAAAAACGLQSTPASASASLPSATSFASADREWEWDMDGNMYVAGDVQAGEAGAQVLLVAVQVFAMPPSG